MSKKEKTTLLVIVGLIITLILYVTVRLWTSDQAISILPGWHTTIYPPEIYWIFLTIIILLYSLIIYLLFKGTIRLLRNKNDGKQKV
jgi:hypothetical protein